ncbi:hypothetical protein FJY94_06460 [Candidatus Kaiserbacteria bacterium]|nr:hypothetical protein [Candidatus Kaiserbacteria bacterium]
MELLANLDLLAVGVVIAATTVLGFTVYFQDRNNGAHLAFLLFTLATAIWGVFNYMQFKPAPEVAIWIIRLSLFCAVWQSFWMFQFFSTFPNRDLKLISLRQAVLGALAFAISFLTLTPWVLSHPTRIAADGAIESIANGPAILPFGFFATGLIAAGLAVFLRTTFTLPRSERRPYLEILFGTFLTFALIIVFNFIFPAFLDITRYTQYGSVFIFPFIAFGAHVTLGSRLFNLKIASTSALVMFLSIVSFIEIVNSNTVSLIMFRISTFLLVLIFGLNLIRTILREIEEREIIQKLSDEKSEFLTFASHEIRNPITAIRGYASLIYDGTTGEANPETCIAAQKILVRGNDVLLMIGEYLSKSKMEIGKVSFSVGTFDCVATVAALVEDFRPNALIRNLTLETKVDHLERILINADEPKLREVLGNIIDNSLKYTKEGGVTVSVERHGVSARIIVSDTGVGIPPETLPQLFKKFSRADAQKVNLLGTGVGLYLGKQFIEGMGGRIWAESDGLNKGSRFIIEFPVAAAATTVAS